MLARGASRGKPEQERESSPVRDDINTVAHTYTSIVIHALFSTKNREPWIDNEMKDELFAYMGGIVNKLGGHSLLVNGVADHVHMLLVQPPSLPLADLMEKVKANSSSWVKKRFPACRNFAWQIGYAAFSVSESQVEQVKKYIAGQEEHHRIVSFQEELIAFLKKNGVAYDSRYVFG
ncbi:MAG: IS200/IS605 family transposase [Terriglobia bacterium]